MTEERIKELIYKNGLMSLEEIGKMVAAEAWNGGIEEMQVSGWDAVIGEAEKIDMPSGGKLNDWSALMNRLCSAHQRAAEQLKEKGK